MVQSIAVAKSVLGDAVDVDLETFTYGKDQSLIIYRSSRKYIAHSLAPFGQAQALHPAPYPDPEGRPNDLEADWRLQIYYAWWNGYILGYPEHFVDSYCETFHNGLGSDDKVEEMRRAKTDASDYFSELQLNSRLYRRCKGHVDKDECLSEVIDSHSSSQISNNIRKIMDESYSRLDDSNLPASALQFDPVTISFGLDPPLESSFWNFLK